MRDNKFDKTTTNSILNFKECLNPYLPEIYNQCAFQDYTVEQEKFFCDAIYHACKNNFTYGVDFRDFLDGWLKLEISSKELFPQHDLTTLFKEFREKGGPKMILEHIVKELEKIN
jgi:hypothetical protein